MFITIEGGDGAGKSTLIAGLRENFEREGLEVLVTREPGGCALGEEIRSWLLTKHPDIHIGERAELLLFLASRAQHLEETIEPALKGDKVVICDRFHDSSVAYQGYGRGLGADFVWRLCHDACGKRMPDATLYLDVDPEVGQERRNRSDAEPDDRIESENTSFHESVRAGYWKIAQEDAQRFHIVDAHQTAEQVLQQALEFIRPKLST